MRFALISVFSRVVLIEIRSSSSRMISLRVRCNVLQPFASLSIYSGLWQNIKRMRFLFCLTFWPCWRCAISLSKLMFCFTSLNSGNSVCSMVCRSIAKSFGSIIKSTSSSPINCSNSLGVKAAWATPRRAIKTTSFTALCLKTFNASSATSVFSSCAVDNTNIRAISNATFPIPMTTAVCDDKSTDSWLWSGWPLYQPTKVEEPKILGNSAPGIDKVRLLEPPVA